MVFRPPPRGSNFQGYAQLFGRLAAEFFKATQIGMFRAIRMDHTNCLQLAIKTLQFNSIGFRVAFVQKCSQDPSLPEPFRQEYIISYQRICSDSENAAPLLLLLWKPYVAALPVPDHFATAHDLLNWLHIPNHRYL